MLIPAFHINASLIVAAVTAVADWLQLSLDVRGTVENCWPDDRHHRSTAVCIIYAVQMAGLRW